MIQTMKIKFMTNNPMGGITHGTAETPGVFVNASAFFIKHYYDLHGQNPNAVWLPANLIVLDEPEVMIQQLIKEQPDIIGFSVFIWNENLQFSLAQKIKQHLPKCVIVVGGPQLTAHKEPGFFDQHPYVDYVVYGDGERAFQQIIDHESGLLEQDQFVNIVTRDRVYPYEVLSDPLYLSTSQFLGQKEYVTQHIEYLESRGIRRSQLLMGVEFARGCMYSCSFCDWSQNLTKKVKRRSNSWKDDLDFIHSLDIAIRETDANFGQWEEDIKIYDYAVSLFDPARNFRFIAWNTPKLKKEPAYHIIKNNIKVYNSSSKVSLQDVNTEVLALMDRPSMSWEVHADMINRLKAELGERGDQLELEFMIGVAGQTYDSVVDSLYKIWTDTKSYNTLLHHWAFLPNMPGADPLYQKLHRLEWGKFYQSAGDITVDADSLDTLYQKLSRQELVVGLYEETAVMSTATMKLVDIMSCQLFALMLRRAGEKIHPSRIKNPEPLFAKFKQQARQAAMANWNTVQPYYEKYGFIIRGSFDDQNKRLLSHWEYQH